MSIEKHWSARAGRIYKTLLFLGLILVAAAIFGFSSQNRDDSISISTRLARVVIEVVDPEFRYRPAQEQENVIRFADKLVRKFAHFLEYAALGFFIRLLVGCFRLRPPTRLSWLLGTLYACTDEIHQLFTPQRTAQWQDVLLDSAGVLAGITVAYALLVLGSRWREKKAKEKTD